jgi:hypothetical protein
MTAVASVSRARAGQVEDAPALGPADQREQTKRHPETALRADPRERKRGGEIPGDVEPLPAAQAFHP